MLVEIEAPPKVAELIRSAIEDVDKAGVIHVGQLWQRIDAFIDEVEAREWYKAQADDDKSFWATSIARVLVQDGWRNMDGRGKGGLYWYQPANSPYWDEKAPVSGVFWGEHTE